jgi:hypothetical protein
VPSLAKLDATVHVADRMVTAVERFHKENDRYPKSLDEAGIIAPLVPIRVVAVQK